MTPQSKESWRWYKKTWRRHQRENPVTREIGAFMLSIGCHVNFDAHTSKFWRQRQQIWRRPACLKAPNTTNSADQNSKPPSPPLFPGSDLVPLVTLVTAKQIDSRLNLHILLLGSGQTETLKFRSSQKNGSIISSPRLQNQHQRLFRLEIVEKHYNFPPARAKTPPMSKPSVLYNEAAWFTSQASSSPNKNVSNAFLVQFTSNPKENKENEWKGWVLTRRSGGCTLLLLLLLLPLLLRWCQICSSLKTLAV